MIAYDESVRVVIPVAMPPSLELQDIFYPRSTPRTIAVSAPDGRREQVRREGTRKVLSRCSGASDRPCQTKCFLSCNDLVEQKTCAPPRSQGTQRRSRKRSGDEEEVTETDEAAGERKIDAVADSLGDLAPHQGPVHRDNLEVASPHIECTSAIIINKRGSRQGSFLRGCNRD